MLSYIGKALSLLDATGRRKAVVVAVLMVAASVLEGIGVGIVFPLAKLVLSPEFGAQPGLVQGIMSGIGASTPFQRALAASTAFLAIILLKNALAFYSIVYQVRFVRGAELHAASRLLGSYFSRSYRFHLQTNSAFLIRNVSETIPAVFGAFLMPALRLATELMTVLAISVVLVVINPVLTLIAFSITALVVVGLYRLLQDRFHRWGQERLRLLGERQRCLQQGLGGVKEVMVFGKEGFFVGIYRRIQNSLGGLLIRVATAGELRRIAIEFLVLAMLLMGLLLVISAGERGADLLAFLGVVAAAALRLMPSANRILMSLESMRGSTSFIDTALADIPDDGRNVAAVRQPFPPLQSGIKFEDVSFSYDEERGKALTGVNLAVQRGEALGLVGPSGGGKSTLVDIMLGLLPPDNGRVLVDGRNIATDPRSWQEHVGYVPQTIFLLDDTLRRNIAFGVPDREIDESRLTKAVELAQLSELVAAMPEGLNAFVGERGMRLSGGQRQRIGIARALYGDPDILVFDEATSALDSETEHEVTKAIYTLRGKKTLIVVAHRLTTLRECSRLIFIDKGKVIADGSFADLLSQCPPFRRMAERSDLGEDLDINETVPPGSEARLGTMP